MTTDKYKQVDHVKRSIEYIEDNLNNQNLSLKSIADVAGYSPYYFSKLFHMLTGMTLNRYILDRRLARAADDILATNLSISEIAMYWQFASQSTFTRAFKSRYCVSPVKYRKENKPHFFELPNLSENLYLLESLNEISPAKITELPTKYFIGCRYYWTVTEGYDILEWWENFRDHLSPEISKTIHLSDDTKLFGISEYVQSSLFNVDHVNSYVAAFEINSPSDTFKNLPADFIFKTIPANTYAVFENIPSTDCVLDACRFALSAWIPSHGYTLAEADNFDIYSSDILNGDDSKANSLWVPIEELA